MAAHSFPLLRLPNLKDVLLNMGTIQQFCFSMVSEKTKKFIRELGVFKDVTFDVHYSDYISYGIYNPINEASYWFSFDNGNVYFFAENAPQHEEAEFSAPQFDEKSFLSHFLYIINPLQIETLNLLPTTGARRLMFNEERFKMLKDSLEGLKVVDLQIKSIQQLPQNLDVLFPTTRLTFFDFIPESKSSALRKVLTKGIHHMVFVVSVPLNELLLARCSRLCISNSQLTEKEINMFLNHWTSGLKPELEYLSIQKYGPSFNQDVILEGIPYEVAPTERRFQFPRGISGVGGIDVQLSRGSKATIVFDYSVQHNCSIISAAVHGSQFISFK